MSVPHAQDVAVPRSEQRRRAILDATLQIIAEGGVDAVTHRRVAATAGAPLGSTTYYFLSREVLIREAFRAYIASVDSEIEALYRDFGDASIAGIASVMVELTRREAEEPGMLRAEYELILAAARDPELAADLRAWERANASQLAEILEQLGTTRPVETARGVIRLVRGHELDSLSREVDPTELGRQITHLIRAATADAAAR